MNRTRCTAGFIYTKIVFRILEATSCQAFTHFTHTQANAYNASRSGPCNRSSGVCVHEFCIWAGSDAFVRICAMAVPLSMDYECCFNLCLFYFSSILRIIYPTHMPNAMGKYTHQLDFPFSHYILPTHPPVACSIIQSNVNEFSALMCANVLSQITEPSNDMLFD